MDLGEEVGLGGGRKNGGLEELVAHEIHAGFGRAEGSVTALFVAADHGAGVGGGVEADGQHGEEDEVDHGEHGNDAMTVR